MTVEQEKVQGMLKEKLREKGWKVTRQRLSILQTLAEHKGQHLAAEDIFELMKDEYPEMGLATVYRTLQLLYEIQLIDRIHFNDGCIRYEIGHIFDGDSKHSHHHLICRTCGRVMPFEDDFLEDLYVWHFFSLLMNVLNSHTAISSARSSSLPYLGKSPSVS